MSPAVENTVQLALGKVTLAGSLYVPAGALGLVIFAHGSGSSRLSPRNVFVARELQKSSIGTLLFDLLTTAEETVDDRTAELRFNISFLARRLLEATEWLKARPEARNLKLGYFGASTGAGAALVAAAEKGGQISAVVSRGGRPDMAEAFLAKVEAPTLLIVGGDDFQVIDLNKRALARLQSEKKLVIIPGATHLFEQPGALEQVAQLASEWFGGHFKPRKSTS